MRRPLFIFCLLAAACIRIGCGLGLVSSLSDRVAEAIPVLEQRADLDSGQAATEARQQGQTVPETVSLPEQAGGELTLQGQVVQKDENYFYINSIVVQTTNLLQLQLQFPKDLKLKCKLKNTTAEEMQMPLLGSSVLLTGSFEAFEAAGNPGQFDSYVYYAGQGLCGKLTDCRILKCSEEYSRLKEGLFGLRSYFSQRIYEIFPEREATVMNTILLGERSSMDTELKTLYKRNGILHIASISGLHISTIAMALYGLLRRMGVSVRLSGSLSSVVLLLYGVMAGMSTSAQRAIGMFLLHMLGNICGRTYDMLTALGVVGLGMVLLRPDYLWDAGFLMSYGAVLGIGILYPAFKGGRGEKKLGKIRDSFYAGLSVTLVLLPIQLWFYYEVPVYSVVLNLLVVPTMSILVIWGMGLLLLPGTEWLTALSLEVLPFEVSPLAALPFGLLRLYEGGCRLLEQLPFHTWTVGRPEVWQVVGYYLCLALFVLLAGRRGAGAGTVGESSARKMAAGAAAAVESGAGKRVATRSAVKNSARGLLKWIFPALGVLLFCIRPAGTDSITFLDVGQGDAICLRTADKRVYLFDCGSSSESRVGEYVLLPYLKYYGITRIDGIFVSHPDEDHTNGILELLENRKEWGITVKQLILPALSDTQEQEEFQTLLQAAGVGQGAGAGEGAEDGIKAGMGEGTAGGATGGGSGSVSVSYVRAGDVFTRGNLQILCLHPEEGIAYADGNAYSQCFYISLQEETDTLDILLTGDVEAAGEQELLARLRAYGIKDVEVLKVAHHGSRYSTGEELLRLLRPELAVISCGEGNSYGHPHEETLKRLEAVGSRIWTTAEQGALMIEAGRGNEAE